MEVGFPPPPDEDVLSGLLHALGLDEDDVVVVVVVVVVAVGPLGLLLLLLLLLPLADGELELQELRKKEKEGKKKENKKRDAMPASVPVRQTRIFLPSFSPRAHLFLFLLELLPLVLLLMAKNKRINSKNK